MFDLGVSTAAPRADYRGQINVNQVLLHRGCDTISAELQVEPDLPHAYEKLAAIVQTQIQF